ncbi:MAG: hypothetical protein ABIV48_08695 [Pyrinomonadaceae bacterium]
MNTPKILSTTVFVFGLLIFLPAISFGQALEPSYEVSMQLLIGSNQSGNDQQIPQNLSAVTRQLKSSFPYSKFRLAGTFLGRVSNNGDFFYKSLSNIFGQATDHRYQTFLEWSVRDLKNGSTLKGPRGFQAHAFNFGARVPVITAMPKDPTGKETVVVNYEQIGINLNRIGLPENVPTLVGTLNLPGAADTLFLVITIRSADL